MWFWEDKESKERRERLAQLEQADREDEAFVGANRPTIEIKHYKAGDFLSYDNSVDPARGARRSFYSADCVVREVPRRQITGIEIFTSGRPPTIEFSEFENKNVVRGAVPGRIMINVIGKREGPVVNCHRSIVDDVLRQIIDVWKNG